MQLLVLVAVVVGLSYLFGCWEDDKWTGSVYPNKHNLTVHRKVPGEYSTLEACRAVALEMIRDNGWRNADYECGLNCEPFGSGLINICEETLR